MGDHVTLRTKLHGPTVAVFFYNRQVYNMRRGASDIRTFAFIGTHNSVLPEYDSINNHGDATAWTHQRSSPEYEYFS
jgi:hypothetical protein